MSSEIKIAESIIYQIHNPNRLRILNQLLLPTNVVYESIDGVEDAWKAIHEMKIRGAPAIAILGLLAVAVELSKPNVVQSLNKDSNLLFKFVQQKGQYLCTSRPTAINIRKEFDTLLKFIQLKKQDEKIDFEHLVDLIKTYCNEILENDLVINHKIGENGCEHIRTQYNHGKKFNILTHCNTGSLATAGYGTALGVIRNLHSKGLLELAYCTETRPYNQGARLTAWELFTEKIPSILICDNMVASLMSTRKIDAVVVGADRVSANGDTANKIGTYQIAILAKHFGVPFYVASPLSTIDFTITNGYEIPIEERPEQEMKWVGNVQIAPTDMKCWNPAFDITPAQLITGGIITERRVIDSDKLLEIYQS